MNTFENISKELKQYFSQHSIFGKLLSLDFLLIFAGVIFMVINGIFPRIGLGSGFFGNILSSLAYWAFILGLLLAYANMNEKYMYSGMFLYAGLYVFYFLRNIKFFRLSYLITAAIFGGLGYLVYKRNQGISSEKTVEDEQ